jgi:hypothetical protein
MGLRFLTAFLIVGVLCFSGCVQDEQSQADYGSDAVVEGSADYQIADEQASSGQVDSSVGDTHGCELLSGEMRDGCYFEVATGRGDSSFCNEIVEFSIKSHCMALTERDPDYCIPLDSDYRKFQCYSTLAEMLNDAGICDPIDELDAPAWKQACLKGAQE